MFQSILSPVPQKENATFNRDLVHTDISPIVPPDNNNNNNKNYKSTTTEKMPPTAVCPPWFVLAAFLALLAVVTDVPTVRAFHARTAALPMPRAGGSSCCGRCPKQRQHRGPAVRRGPLPPPGRDRGRGVVVVLAVPEVGEDEECDFDAMLDMHDECMTHRAMPHSIPTAAMHETGMLERTVHCAEEGDCPVEEMTELIEELERLNLECEGHINRECNVAAVEARNILKVALASQAAMSEEVRSRVDRQSP